MHREGKAPLFFNGIRSFKDTLTGRQGSFSETKTVVVDNQVNGFHGLHGKALIARMLDLDALRSIHIILNEICLGLGRVQYLGGLSVLISFEDKETATTVLEAVREVLRRFSSVDYWEGQSLGYDRLAWLKIMGIPLQLINNEVIDAVGGVFGKIVHRVKRPDDDGDLSFEYIGVLVGDGKRICEEVTLVWRERKFKVWVLEESGEWVLEFYQVSIPSESITEPTPDPMPKHTNECEMEDADLNKVGEDEAPSEFLIGNGSLSSELERPPAFFGSNSKDCMVGSQSMCMGNQKGLSVPNMDEHVQVECIGNQEPLHIIINGEREVVGTVLSNGLEAEQGGPPNVENRPSYITCRPKRSKKTKKKAQNVIIPDLNQEPEITNTSDPFNLEEIFRLEEEVRLNFEDEIAGKIRFALILRKKSLVHWNLGPV
ncbi:hypothetical protein HanIR_Chr15g0734441 [Helianthus annuus]|nr:hypothetical protein HanIR_Chr15g0734441 [Helianthus annuus]